MKRPLSEEEMMLKNSERSLMGISNLLVCCTCPLDGTISARKSMPPTKILINNHLIDIKDIPNSVLLFLGISHRVVSPDIEGVAEPVSDAIFDFFFVADFVAWIQEFDFLRAFTHCA